MKLQSKIKNALTFISLTAVIYLCGLLFLKYHLNNLSLLEFRIDYIGNILNILIALLIVVGCIGLNYSKKKIDSNKTNLLLGLQIVSVIAIGFIFFIIKLNVINSGSYLFGFPIKKVYTGFLFVFSVFLQIYSMLFIWGIIIGSEGLIILRTLIRSTIAVAVLIIFSVLYVWNVKEYNKRRIKDSKYNYGFVPGAAVYSRGKPSPIFEGRLRESLELYRKGIIKQIFLTGGNAPGEISESEAALNYLMILNVPRKDIIIENQSSTTTEQIKYLRSEIFSVKDIDTVVIISDGFHLSRIIQISKFFKLNTIGVASDYTLSLEKTIFYRARESVALLLFWFFAI